MFQKSIAISRQTMTSLKLVLLGVLALQATCSVGDEQVRFISVLSDDLGGSMTRAQYVAAAKLADLADRYDDMKEAIKMVAKMDEELTAEERNLLSVAYIKVVGERRASWRVLTSGAPEVENEQEELLRSYYKLVEQEVCDICNDITDIIDKHLIKTAMAGKSAESQVFYYKMKGDYMRYVAEVKTVGDQKSAAKAAGLDAYKKAFDIAKKELAPTHKLRLGLALNFSVFYYEIMQNQEEAIGMAKQAFDDAIDKVDDLDDDSYKDSTLILQLLRDNMTLWNSSEEQDRQDDVERYY